MWRFAILLTFIWGLLPALATAQESSPRITLGSEPSGQTIDVVGLSEDELSQAEKLSPDDARALVQVRVAAEIELPPMEGRLARAGSALRFAPRFPLEAGVSYRASFDGSRLSADSSGKPLVEILEVAATRIDPTTVVTQIYPTCGVLPENQLKFYIHFSAPMSRGEAYQHIHLLDENDQQVDGAFLELGEELWDADQRRFTLLFDPGRVKRGLKPREELGPPIVEGRQYTLVIDNAWRDATRTPLNAGARKHFSVGPPDETPIDPARWQIAPPAAGSHDPLLVRFGESLDHSLLERVVWVAAPNGSKVSGTIATGDGEACWQFTPQNPWPAGQYKLSAASTLEDLAGNAIGRPFEVDQFNQVDHAIETTVVEVPFDVR